jgi:hypothetical protein
MAFTGADFLGVAQILIELESGAEPEERSAIGRAYYAAYLLARDYVRDELGSNQDRPGGHSAVRKLIEPTNQQLARDLWRLSDLREEADYVIPYPGPDPRAAAEVAIELAKLIIASVDALPRSTNTEP